MRLYPSTCDDNVDIYEFWLPYSDVMAGLLGIFALLLIVTIYRLGEPINDARAVIRERHQIVQELTRIFKDDDRLEITEAGSIRFQGEILFQRDQDSLSADGKQLLVDVMPRYLDVIAKHRAFIDQLSRIMVEGHADPTYATDDSLAAYLYNLDLSQRRAANVVRFLLTDDHFTDYSSLLRTYFAASGRSSSELVYDSTTGLPDYDRSRRIQINFKMKDRQLLDGILEALYGDSHD